MAMLISGNPGAGTSRLTSELSRRGVRAMDADEVPGLAAWMNAHGEIIGDSTLAPSPELLANCYWGWAASGVQQVIETLGSTAGTDDDRPWVDSYQRDRAYREDRRPGDRPPRVERKYLVVTFVSRIRLEPALDAVGLLGIPLHNPDPGDAHDSVETLHPAFAHSCRQGID